MARNRCAIARCAGSPTASAVTGGKIVKTQNRCAHSSVEAVRLVCKHGGHGQNGPQSRAQDAEGCICIVKNLNDGHRAIGKAEIILTSSLKQFRLDNIEVCCGLQKYWFALWCSKAVARLIAQKLSKVAVLQHLTL
jgi:hypothetical protein